MPANTIDITAAVEAEKDVRTAAVRVAFEELLSWTIAGANSPTLHRFEKGATARLAAVGLALLELWLVVVLPNQVPAQRRYGRGWYGYLGLTREVVRSRLGEVWAPRPTWRLVGGSGPLLMSDHDRRLGLAAGRMSLNVHLLVARVIALLPFDTALEVLRSLGGYVPSKRSALGIADQLGPQASAFLDEMPVPEDDGEILVIQVDGKGAPMMRPEEHRLRCRPHQKRPRGLSKRAFRRWRRHNRHRVRRKAGDKSKNAKMATVGVIYTLRRLEDGTLEGPIHKRVIGTFAPPLKLFQRLHREAVRRGYGTKETIFLADGANHLWRLKDAFFPQATGCLDWFHLSEYLWTAGGTVHAAGSDALAAWVRERQGELRLGKVDDVIAAMDTLNTRIARTGPGTKGRRERLAKARQYLDKRRHIVPYDKLLAKDLDIATGMIEGAVRHAIGVRLDGPGCRWSLERAEHVLALRCVVINGHWDDFTTRVITTHERLTPWVVPRITPAHPMSPHAAKSRKKAA